MRPTGFRPDIEGLRTIAVVLVMLYHAGLAPRHGFLGVDVFFVISGFLITGLLVRELDETGTVSWPRFLSRRARRLLPAAVLVLLGTAVAAWFLVPGLRRHDVGTDIAAAAAYVVNWVLADRAVDYLAGDAAPSPVQHYWSLSVEEQFYVGWPLLLVAAVWVLRRARPALLDRGPGGGPRRRVLGTLLGIVCVPSLSWSLWLGVTDPPSGYFPTTTRAWELGIGAALAIWMAGHRPRTLGGHAPTVGVAGLAAIGGTALWLPAGAAWPGAWALLPTLGTGALLYAGWAAPASLLSRVLGSAPMVWVGGLSYSLYLWHWPVRVLGEWALGGRVATWQTTLLVAASVVPAYLGHRLVERPVHEGSGIGRRLGRAVRPALVMGLALSLTGVAAGWSLHLARSPFATTPAGGRLPALSTLGANVLGGAPTSAPPVTPGEWVTPDPLLAGEDRPAADVDHCQVGRDVDVPVRCDFGDPRAARTVALVGDSKAMQWLPALEELARQRHWRIVTFGKSACTFAEVPARLAGTAYPSCDTWSAAVLRELAALRPDTVVTSANATTDTAAALTTGFAQRWGDLERRGMRVVVVGNNPVSPDDLDVCAARHPRDLDRCAFARAPAVARSGLAPMRAAAARVPGVTFVDLTDWICPGTTCPLVIGHVTVNRAGDHVTATYARTLAAQIGRHLPAVG